VTTNENAGSANHWIVGVDTERLCRPEKLFKRNPSFHSGDRRTDAEMDSAAECEVRRQAAICIVCGVGIG
jgi:hypothetical protein